MGKVVIAGGGPTGLMLAGELALAGVEVAVVERRKSQNVDGVRALGLHSRTIEVLDQRGIAERFVSEGQPHKMVFFHSALDISDCPTRHNYTLALGQNHTERILADWVSELPVTMYRGREVTGFAQDEGGVDVEISDGSGLRADYLVGCDGGRSVVRKTAGIEFPGWDPTVSWLIVEADKTEEPAWGFRENAAGTHGIGKLEDGRRMRAVLTERRVKTASEPALDEVKEALTAIYGTDFGIHNATWLSRFTDMARQAARYRDRRVLLAGDAAHVHAPVGGQGLNLGMQDAVNLGWKLAQVMKGEAPDSLLHTYHEERHPVGARVLRTTMAQTALRRPDQHTKALGEHVAQMLSVDGARRQFAAQMAGLDIRYDFGDGHPLLGRRMPDLEVNTAHGVTTRVFSFLHKARPVVLDLGAVNGFNTDPWRGRVQFVKAEYQGAWELPAIGKVSAPKAVLVRPDGHVAWVGEQSTDGLDEALTKWCGAGRLAD